MNQTALSAPTRLGELDPQYGGAPAIGLVLDHWAGECLGLDLINGRQEQGYCVPSTDRQLVRVYPDPTCDESALGSFAIYSVAAVIGIRYVSSNPNRNH